MALQNLTIDSGNLAELGYVGNWDMTALWQSAGETGSLSWSEDPHAQVSFDFPAPANAFYYYGIKRSKGGLYAICIDDPACNNQSANAMTIDAFDPKDDGGQPPVLLFSKVFGDFEKHHISLINLEDQRSITPPGKSQITLDRFEIQVKNGSGPVTGQNTISESLGPATSSSFLSTPSTSSPSTSSPSFSTSGNSVPVGSVVGGVIGGSALVLIFGTFVFFYVQHRKRKYTTENRGSFVANTGPIPILSPYRLPDDDSRAPITSFASIPTKRRIPLTNNTHDQVRIRSSQGPTSPDPEPQPQREIEDSEIMTSPPDYNQIFRDGNLVSEF